jgi:dihydrodipicolinate synthase/N-acetylneuraminate lyase
MTQKEIIARVRGVFAPVVTPFNRQGKIDEKLFEENLRRYVGIGLGGVLVSGSTGEMPYLSGPERLRLIELARRIVRPPELLFAGTGLETTRGTLELSREAVERGVDGMIILTPNYYKSRMDSAALTAHYSTLADGLRRPVLIYNIPQFTGVRMEPRAIAALARHPNIIGLKESSGDFAYMKAILRAVPKTFRVLAGSATIFLQSLRAGAAGGVLGQSDFAPDLCVALYEAFCRRRMKTARDLQARLVPLVQKISIPFGVPGIKAALEFCGYAGGNPRPPLLPASPAQKRIILDALRESRAGLDF